MVLAAETSQERLERAEREYFNLESYKQHYARQLDEMVKTYGSGVDMSRRCTNGDTG